MTLSSITPMRSSTAIEPGVFGLSFAALVLWLLGYPDQALQKSEAALYPGPGAVSSPLAWPSPGFMLPCPPVPPGESH